MKLSAGGWSFPQGAAPGYALVLCARECVCVCVCVHACGYLGKAHLRRGVNTLQHLRTTVGSKDGADPANRKRTGADVHPDPGGRDQPPALLTHHPRRVGDAPGASVGGNGMSGETGIPPANAGGTRPCPAPPSRPWML